RWLRSAVARERGAEIDGAGDHGGAVVDGRWRPDAGVDPRHHDRDQESAVMWWAYAAVAALATITLLLAPAGWGWRSLATAAAALAALAGGLVMSLGHPRPAVGAGDVLVVAAQFAPGVTIWVWTAGAPPIAYALPWTDEAAGQLQEGLRMA